MPSTQEVLSKCQLSLLISLLYGSYYHYYTQTSSFSTMCKGQFLSNSLLFT